MQPLLDATKGQPEVVIGLIDGPVEASHPNFGESNLRMISSEANVVCQQASSLACQHGTFVAGILGAARSSDAPGLCPDCTVLVRPIFCEARDPNQCPEVTPQNLSLALRETVDAGAKIINLSLGLAKRGLQDHPDLQEAFDYAFRKESLVVGASGNQGRVGHNPLFNHPWVIPVVACDLSGRLEAASNIGSSVGRRGLMAPGKSITSTSSAGGYVQMSGTSMATPFVSGTIGLLWSLFPNANAAQIRNALLQPGIARKSIIPPLLNAAASMQALQSN